MRPVGVALCPVEAAGAVQPLFHQIKGRRLADALLLGGGDVLSGQAAGQIAAGLDLHEAQHAALAGDEIDLPEPAVIAVSQQLIAPAHVGKAHDA